MANNFFTVRALRVTINVTRTNTDGTDATQTYTFEQHRMRITVRQGGNQFGNARLEIYGVPLDSMNQIARLWLETLTPQNTDTVNISVFSPQGFVPFFKGVITWSAVDASNLPGAALIIEANEAFALSNVTLAPTSGAGPARLSDVLNTICSSAGFTLRYSADAPEYQLSDFRVSGSPLDQIGRLMNYFPDLRWFASLQELIVLPAAAPFSGDTVRIAADTGMMGNPVYSSSGLQLATLFNPVIRPGVALDVHTIFDFVNRTKWVAAVLAHQLDVNVPNGLWSTNIAASSYGLNGNNQ